MDDDGSQQAEVTKMHDLLDLASEFASLAMSSLIDRAATDTATLERIRDHYVDWVFALEMEFIFPGLTHDQRDTLVALKKARNGLAVQFGGEQQWRTANDRKCHTTVVRNLKVDFLRLRTQLQRLELEKQLDRLQERILREELLSLPPDKTESTTFFFRRECSLGRQAQRGDGQRETSFITTVHPARVCGGEPAVSAQGPRTAPVRSDPSPTTPLSQLRTIPVSALGEGGKTILFVAAELGDYGKCLATLGEAGFHMQAASNLTLALECAIDSPPNLVILDLGLPLKASTPEKSGGAQRFLKGLSLLGDSETPVVIGLCPSEELEPEGFGEEDYPLTARIHAPVDPQRLLGAVYVALDDTRIERPPQRCLNLASSQEPAWEVSRPSETN